MWDGPEELKLKAEKSCTRPLGGGSWVLSFHKILFLGPQPSSSRGALHAPPHPHTHTLWPCSAICGWDAKRTKAPHSQNTFPLKNPICQTLAFQAHRQQGGGGESLQPRGDPSPLPASSICPGQHGGPRAFAACSVGPRPVTSPFWASVSPCVTCRGGMGCSIICHSQKNIGEK